MRYIMRDNPPKHEKGPWAFLFFDSECRADTAYQGDDSRKVHTPNLCVSQTVCKGCITVEEDTYSCLACGAREHIFEGDDCVDRFNAYLSQNFGEFKEVVIFAHNARAYDKIFVILLCSCDSNSLLAVDLVAAYIKHRIQQRNTPSTEMTMTTL